jgi:hypothetical protein
MEGQVEYRLIVKTDEHGRPRIEGSSGELPANATLTITGSEEAGEAPWVRMAVFNDVIIDTGVVRGARVATKQGDPVSGARA